MRPLLLLLSLFLATFTGTAFVLYAALSSASTQPSQQRQDGFSALFSFTSPGSLFPPSAIISLTDDNSTFFLARPAAFGPSLPRDGLSSLLWVGRGFGDDALNGELGCSDSPEWNEDQQHVLHDSNVPPSGTPGSINGTVVLLKRGGCGFLAKVLWAQNRGAVAVIVGDDVRGGGLIRMFARGDTTNVTIPSVFTSHTTAHLLSSLLAPQSQSHKTLRVTLTPTNISTSPFLDTLLVLVVSPLVTLTVVYALLLIRSRIRRRRWRAPKSLVERLPVRTYHTMSDSNISTPTPTSSSPATPLLQSSSASSPPTTHATARCQSEMPTTSSVIHGSSRAREEEKRESGLAEWRRRYGGRQRECVVCLEEYEDGISQVMSLPCGHEFHVECITPWLVTRRRTCPICKGDVVRSLAQSSHDRPLVPSSADTDSGSFQARVLNPQTALRVSPIILGLAARISSSREEMPRTQSEHSSRHDDRGASRSIPTHFGNSMLHRDSALAPISARSRESSRSRASESGQSSQHMDRDH